VSAGKYVILLICTLGLLSASAAVVYHRGRASRPLTFWGRQPALLIANAPRVNALQLRRLPSAKTQPNGEMLRSLGKTYRVVKREDAAESRGLSNIRRSLIADESFAWVEGATDCEPDWKYALEFQQGEETTRVLFDFACKRAALEGSERSVSIRPSNRDFEAFLEEQFFSTASEADVVERHGKTVPTTN
jgi:hypothetical protein